MGRVLVTSMVVVVAVVAAFATGSEFVVDLTGLGIALFVACRHGGV